MKSGDSKWRPENELPHDKDETPELEVKVTELSLTEGVTPVVEVLLREICLRSQKVIGLSKEDEPWVNARMAIYKRRFAENFTSHDYISDQRIRDMMRILDFCYKVGFDMNNFFDQKFYHRRDANQVLGDFKKLMRMTLIELGERNDLIPYLMSAKIPLIKGGSNLLQDAALNLADQIEQHCQESGLHLKAAMVLLTQALQNGNQNTSAK